MLKKSDRQLIQELKGRLQEVAAERLHSVIVYGSRVWGKAGPESDLDVAVNIQGLTSELETAVQEATYQVMGNHDFTPLISLKVFEAGTFAAFQRKGFSCYRKVA